MFLNLELSIHVFFVVLVITQFAQLMSNAEIGKYIQLQINCNTTIGLNKFGKFHSIQKQKIKLFKATNCCYFYLQLFLPPCSTTMHSSALRRDSKVLSCAIHCLHPLPNSSSRTVRCSFRGVVFGCCCCLPSAPRYCQYPLSATIVRFHSPRTTTSTSSLIYNPNAKDFITMVWEMGCDSAFSSTLCEKGVFGGAVRYNIKCWILFKLNFNKIIAANFIDIDTGIQTTQANMHTLTFAFEITSFHELFET